jgi:DNA-binding NtrC family response regulator
VGYVVRGAFTGPNILSGDSGCAPSGEALFQMGYRDAKDVVLKEFQRKYTAAIIAACGGDQAAAAERMGLTRFGLQKMLNEIKT